MYEDFFKEEEQAEERITPPPVRHETLIKELTLPLFTVKGWMRFLGVLLIACGVIAAVTVFGIIFAWLPIWMGIIMLKAATAVETAYSSGDKNQLLDSLSQIKTFITIYAITVLVGLVFAVGVFGLAMSGMAFMRGLMGGMLF